LKDTVYKNSPNSVAALKQNIKYCILNVTTETLHKLDDQVREIEQFQYTSKEDVPT